MKLKIWLAAGILLAVGLGACEEEDTTPEAGQPTAVVAASTSTAVPTKVATRAATTTKPAKTATAAPDGKDLTAGSRPRPILDEHQVEPGDTLREIAQQYYDDENLWPLIWDYNKSRAKRLGQNMEDPDLIYPDWKFLIPNRQRASA